MAFGGAGPLHAARLAKELEIKRVLIPRNPGILCAMGLLLTDLRSDFALTRLRTFGPDAVPAMFDAFHTLTARAEDWFEHEGIEMPNRRITRTVDMRYAGQNYELSVPVPDGEIGPHSLAGLADGFAAVHRRLYGFATDGEPVQLVTFRVEATGVVPKATFVAQPLTGTDAAQAMIEHRPIWSRNAFVPCPVYDRDRFRAGNRFMGPAIVEQMDATTFVPDGMQATVDAWLNIVMEPA